MTESWTERWLERLFDNWLFLPARLTQDSKRPIVRVLGLFAHFVWFIPAMVVAILPMMCLMFADMVIAAWRGDF
jgi:hypothetical protein